MAVKSTPNKRNTYQDKDGKLIKGVTLPEVVNKPITIHAKREYTWGKYSGMAVKVQGENGKFGIVEITAETPIKALNDPAMPKPPYKGMFIEKTSKTGNKYYTIKLLNGKQTPAESDGEPLILPF
jgi:hypothetical protein